MNRTFYPFIVLGIVISLGRGEMAWSQSGSGASRTPSRNGQSPLPGASRTGRSVLPHKEKREQEVPLLSFSEWKERVFEAPSNRTLAGRIPPRELLPLPEYASLDRLVLEYLDWSTHSQGEKKGLATPESWLVAPPSPDFFRIDAGYVPPFQPYAERRTVKPGSKIIFHGDFHGDVRSLITTLDWLQQQNMLDGFKIRSSDTYLVFLGDYADRGVYGIEVFYTLMRLKLANPEQVLLVRGNHEDVQLLTNYGFLREAELKYGRDFNPYPLLRSFEFMPVVIYIGVEADGQGDFLQCNHGGMEPGYHARPLLESKQAYHLIGELRQKDFASRKQEWNPSGAGREVNETLLSKLQDFTPQSPTSPITLGFMWNDFTLFGDEPSLDYNEQRLALIFGQSATEYLLRNASSSRVRLQGVIRAHQHSSVPDPMMRRLVAARGTFRHWQSTDGLAHASAAGAELASLVESSPERNVPSGSVWTFNVSPDSIYGVQNAYSFDTIGILTTAKTFSNWKMQVVNIPVATE